MIDIVDYDIVIYYAQIRLKQLKRQGNKYYIVKYENIIKEAQDNILVAEGVNRNLKPRKVTSEKVHNDFDNWILKRNPDNVKEIQFYQLKIRNLRLELLQKKCDENKIKEITTKIQGYKSMIIELF